MTLTPSMLAALQASLANEEHDWKVLAVSAHKDTGPPIEIHKTFQLQSEPLDMILIVMAQISDGEFERASVYYNGTAFETEEEELYTTLTTMSASKITELQADFLDKLGGV